MTRFLAATLLIVPMLGASGCTQFPALERTRTPDVEAAAYPALVPIEPLIAQARSGGIDPVQTTGTLEARLAGLRARADRLRNPVLSPQERRKLEGGLR